MTLRTCEKEVVNISDDNTLVSSSLEDLTLGSSPGLRGTTVHRHGDPLHGSKRYNSSSCTHCKFFRVLSRSVSHAIGDVLRP